MSKYSKTVLWLGLFLIIMGIVANWQGFKSIIFTGGSGGIGNASPEPPGKNGKCKPGWIYSKTVKLCIPPIQPGTKLF